MGIWVFTVKFFELFCMFGERKKKTSKPQTNGQAKSQSQRQNLKSSQRKAKTPLERTRTQVASALSPQTVQARDSGAAPLK